MVDQGIFGNMGRIRRYKRRFTLIELLVVVALTSMLMVLGVPAFARMIRGNKVDECTRSIKLGLEQAQMRAASERCYVAVIFPNGNVSDSLGSARLGGFRTAYVKKRSKGVYEFSRWLDTEWRNLPEGAVLARVDTKNFETDGGDVTGCTAKVSDDLKGSNAFKAVTGVKDDEGNTLNVGQHSALIFTPYGGTVSSSKLFLLVSEAVIKGDNVTYPTAGTVGEGRTSNYKVLKVNNLTGRVEFYNED